MKIEKVQSGQPISASNFNNLVDTILQNEIRTGKGYKLSKTPSGTILNIEVPNIKPSENFVPPPWFAKGFFYTDENQDEKYLADINLSVINNFEPWYFNFVVLNSQTFLELNPLGKIIYAEIDWFIDPDWGYKEYIDDVVLKTGEFLPANTTSKTFIITHIYSVNTDLKKVKIRHIREYPLHLYISCDGKEIGIPA